MREKKISKGRVSLYLDIYHNGNRWPEFLKIYINKSRPTTEDKEKRQLANQIRAKKETELLAAENGIILNRKKKSCFITWYRNYAKEKVVIPQHRWVLGHLVAFQGQQSLTFEGITVKWIRAFTAFLLERVSNNGARGYLLVLHFALKDAEKEGIIRKNPFLSLDKKDWLKKQDTFRKAYTMDELQILMNTPSKIHPQIKQGYLFSCFTGLRWCDTHCFRWDNIVVRNINGEECYFMYFQQEKTEEIEYIPLSEQAVEFIRQREIERQLEEPSPYVFPFIRETDKKSQPKYQLVKRAIKKWAHAAKLNPKQMSFHTGRHTFATNVLEHSDDGDLYTVSKLLGHKDIQSTQIYAHVRDKRKAAAVRALPKLKALSPV